MNKSGDWARPSQPTSVSYHTNVFLEEFPKIPLSFNLGSSTRGLGTWVSRAVSLLFLGLCFFGHLIPGICWSHSPSLGVTLPFIFPLNWSCIQSNFPTVRYCHPMPAYDIALFQKHTFHQYILVPDPDLINPGDVWASVASVTSLLSCSKVALSSMAGPSLGNPYWMHSLAGI